MKCPVHVGNLAVLQFLLFYLFLGSSQLFFKNHVGFRSVCSSGAILEVGGVGRVMRSALREETEAIRGGELES